MSQTSTATHVDTKITHPLSRLGSIIRRYVTIEGLLSIFIFGAIWFWSAMLIDWGIFQLLAFDWVLDAAKGFRIVALIAALSLLIAIIATKIINRLTREFSYSSLALILERRFPNVLGDRLITAVELADLEKSRSYGYSIEMIKKTIDDVRQKVDEIPVTNVFNWKRLWRQAGALGMLTIGFFVISGIAICAITKSKPGEFVLDFKNSALILAERDLLLQNTPWPRRAYLEVLNFPGEEIRVGRDVPSPKLKVVAYKWVIADSRAYAGWRPMNWSDLDSFKEINKPQLPLQPIRDARFSVDLGPFLYSTAHVFTAPTLPADVAQVPDDPASWPLDRVEQVFTQNEDVKTMLNGRYGSELIAIDGVFTKLTDLAAQPSMSRTIRKLRIPEEVELRYWGNKTTVDMKLRAETNNEFSGTLSDLKESVRFFARGENYDTPVKFITLVPPPMLTELKRDEYRPAYLYHKAPYTEAAKLNDEQKPYLTDPIKLKGLKQVLKDQSISLTGERSRFDIPMGTEFVLYGKSDKPLKNAQLIPKPGKFPGIDPENTDPDPIDLKIENEHGIRFEFNSANKTKITQQTEFDIFLRDSDNVTSKRSIQIVVEDDRAPDVDIAIDVIRRVGSVYMCTPQALIPFTKESKIHDDRGLNRVEYVFSYAEIEPAAVTSKRAEYAAWFWMNSPVIPNLGVPIYRSAALIANLPRVRPALTSVSDRSPVNAFLDEYKKASQSIEQIKSKLSDSLPQGVDQTVINNIDYRASGVEEEDGFDLRKLAPGLRRSSETESQRNYLLSLNILAVDTNVESDKPGMTQNKEQFVFRLVSDGELLAEISREEMGLAEKLEDAIRRLSDVDTKLRSMAARFPALKNPEDFVPDQTRSNELMEQMGKSKDVTAEVNTDYSRIMLEFRANRLPEHLIQQLRERVINKLRDVLANDFPQTEESYNSLHNSLTQSRQPDAQLVFTTQQKITALLAKLREIRGGIGAGLDLKKIITQIEDIIKAEQLSKNKLESLYQEYLKNLRMLTIVPPASSISVTSGQKTTVKVPVRIGDFYKGNLTLKLEPSPGSELKVVDKIVLKEDDEEFTIEITGGFAKGDHWIRVTPDQGEAKDIRIIVK